MFKIDLTLYKKSKWYFQMFDIIFKDNKIKKEPFLTNIGISPSSYRKARTIEQNIGDKLVAQLCESFGYKKPSYELVCSVEKLLNKVYSDVYYKIYTSYESDLEYINSLINENYIIHPVLKLTKLFIMANSKLDTDEFVNKTFNIYEELQKFICFLNEDLLEILDILSLAYDKEIKESMLFKNYKNSLAYYSLSSRLWKEERYAECLFISKRAEEILVKEKNYRRLLSLNVTMMNCLNSLGNYKECYELAKMELLSLKSFVNVDFEYKFTVSHLALCCLPLGKYEECEELISNKSKVSLTDILCFLTAKYFINKKEYESVYSHYYEKFENESKELIMYLDKVLQYKDKRALQKLNSPRVIRYFSDVIKSTCFK